jgi:hypothetical protein
MKESSSYAETNWDLASVKQLKKPLILAKAKE